MSQVIVQRVLLKIKFFCAISLFPSNSTSLSKQRIKIVVFYKKPRDPDIETSTKELN